MLLRASWVFPVTRPPIAGGAVRALNGRIAAVGRLSRRAGEEVVDLPGASLLPGLVNAHVHLELTGLEGRFSPAPFLDWVKGVMEVRRQGGEYAGWSLEGARRLLADGTTCAGDFATGEWSLEALRMTGLRGVAYGEFTGPRAEQAGKVLEKAGAWAWSPGPRGLAPHAPYSVSEPLMRGLGRIAADARIPLAVHASELEEEGALLEKGEGPLGRWVSPSFRGRPVRYLEACGIPGPRTLVVHANYLDEDEIRVLARSRTSVVFCPGSHAFFGHRDHPLPRLLEAGVNAALGTDSLASNDAISMRREMRRCAEAFPDLPVSRILEMATVGGARALGLAHEIGSLEIGKAADLVALEALSVEGVVRNEPKVLGVWREGRAT